ncbi:hypothetical protein ABBQ38_010862 [Trebouxia sp. C0009 RCD-2024]
MAQTCDWRSTGGVSLHLRQHTLPARRVQIQLQNRRVALPIICSESTKAAKQIKSESRAQASFAEHLHTQRSTNMGEVAAHILQQAATSKNIPPYLTLGAALCLEQNRGSNTDNLAKLHGRWRMVFASTTGATLFWYLPVKEYKHIDTKTKTCDLVTYLGPFKTSFSGAYSASSDQEMRFQFTTLVISAFGRTLLECPISLAEKQYTYYWLQENLACARSSGGGIVLLNRTAPLQV